MSESTESYGEEICPFSFTDMQLALERKVHIQKNYKIY